MRTRIPGIKEFQVLDDQEVRDRDSKAKERGKLYADEKRGARNSEVKEGDRVLLKQEKANELTPTFRSEPFRVLDKTGNCVVVESPDGVQTLTFYFMRGLTFVVQFRIQGTLLLDISFASC